MCDKRIHLQEEEDVPYPFGGDLIAKKEDKVCAREARSRINKKREMVTMTYERCGNDEV